MARKIADVQRQKNGVAKPCRCPGGEIFPLRVAVEVLKNGNNNPNGENGNEERCFDVTVQCLSGFI